MGTVLTRTSVLCGIAGAVLYGLAAVLPAGGLNAAPLAPQQDADIDFVLSDELRPGDDLKIDPKMASKALVAGPSGKSILLLRPGVAQKFYLYVNNPTTDEKTVTIKVKVGGKGPEVPVTVKPRTSKRIPFQKPPPPAGAKPPAAETKPDESIVLEGPPFKFQIIQEGDPARTKEYEVRLLTPLQYLEVTQQQYDPGTKTLTFGVQIRKDNRGNTLFSGPPCPVKLALDPRLIPGYRAILGDSNLEDTLTPAASDTELSASGLVIDANEQSPPGTVAINADHYAHAFLYKVSFGSRDTATLDLLTEPSVQADAPRYVLAGPNAKCRVVAQVDNLPLDSKVQVELGLDTGKKGKYEPAKNLVSYSGPRQQSVRLLTATDDGALEFRTAVQEWSAEWPTPGILGKRTARVRLLEMEEKNGKKEWVIKTIKRANKDGSKTEERLESFATVTFLNTKPMGIAFDPKVPKAVDPKKTPQLTVRATTLGPSDLIKSAVFFFGKPVPGDKEGKLPPETFEGKPQEEAGKTWWAVNLPVPPDKKTMEISVKFTNQVGLFDFATTTVEVVESKPAPPGTTATISGQVVLAGLGQGPGEKVVLRAGKRGGPVVQTVETDAAGKFVFKDVAPGTYVVASQIAFPKRQGDATVDVKAGKDAEVTIDLQM